MSTPIFKNAQLVLPHEVVLGSVSVADGLIASVDQGPATHAEGWDLQGDYLMPGFVEMHTDNFERHLMPRPKVQWAEMPALLAHDAEVAAAGITTVFDALGVGDADPDSLRGSTWTAVIDTLDTSAREGLLRADHHLHVRCELHICETRSSKKHLWIMQAMISLAVNSAGRLDQ
jgi:alpha-D-ribose 1-methylphosphonate 5-triphosphate diphosphatase